MARKKKSKNDKKSDVKKNDAAVEFEATDVSAENQPPAAPDVPAVPDVPDVPSGEGAPPLPPPPSKTASHKFNLPPLGPDDTTNKGKGVLKGILERTQEEAEKEAAKLMDSLKDQQDAQRQAREEEDRRKAAEARARVEEERRKRDDALKEYEKRQREKEAAAASREKPAVTATTSIEARKGGKGWIFAVVIGVLVVGGGFAGWKFMTMPEPIAFLVDSPIERARGRAVLTTSVVYGPSTKRTGRSIDAESLIAGVTPEKYVAPKPEPKVRKKRYRKKKKDKRIRIRTGIIGGQKVVR